ncbi:MAG: PIN domain-containing protein [bacterium]
MRKEGLRIFLDSNVIISGLFSDRGAPAILLDLLSLGLPVLCGATGEFNIVEIERNLKKKMPEVLSKYHEYLPLLKLEIIPVPSAREIRDIEGHVADKDLPVLASAIKAKADFLVTGDKKDFGKAKAGRSGSYSFKIVSPAELLHTLLPEILRLLKAE